MSGTVYLTMKIEADTDALAIQAYELLLYMAENEPGLRRLNVSFVGQTVFPDGDHEDFHVSSTLKIHPEESVNFADRPVEYLGLGTRALNGLNRGKIKTIGELMDRTEEDLLAIEHLGVVSVNHVKERMRAFKIRLKPSSS
jgi:hypothetical protein